jgi:preprotein translocase subunit SecD
MKASFPLVIMMLCFYFTATSQNKLIVHKVTFGIYETVNVAELPNSFIQTLKKTDLKFERNNQVPIIGYIEKGDVAILQTDVAKENFKIAKTIYTFDKEGKYCAVVALKRSSTIDISDINNTKCNGNNVEIHFNMKGAKKWAELTKNNIGKMVAFTIDNQIYTLPKIMAEIRTGEALINGIPNEATAKIISETLNSSISK